VSEGPTALGPIELRPIEPGDTSEITALHLAALPSDFITSLGPRFLERVFYASVTGKPEGLGTVARDARGLVGFVTGAHPAKEWYASLVRENRGAIVRGVLSKVLRGPRGVLEVASVARAMRASSSDPEGFPADLGYIAVDARARGQGLGQRLVRAHLEALARRGASGCWTKTRSDAARRMYEATGFERLFERQVRGETNTYYGKKLVP